MKLSQQHLLVIAGCAAIGAVLFSQAVFPVKAVDPAVTLTSLVTSGTTIKEDTLVPVFKVKFNTVQTNEALQKINVKLTSSVAGDPTTDAAISSILEDNRVYDGGWQLWKDASTGTAGTFEQFTDQQMLLSSSSLNYSSGGNFSLTLDTAQTLVAGDTYYIALKTDNSGLPSSATFSATVVTNGVVTSASTQPTITQLATSSMTLSTTPQLVRMEYKDNGTAGFNQGDTLKFIFNQAMDFSYLSSGLSWYIYSYNSNWTSASFGTSPTLTYTNSGGVTNDAVTITAGSSPTVTTSSTVYYSLPSKAGSWSYGSKLFDTTAPTLKKVQLVTDGDKDGKAKTKGDQIAFMFSEGIDAISEDGDASTLPITPNNINTALPLSNSATYDNGSTKPTLTWWGPSVMVLTLNTNLTTDLMGQTVDPASSVKDFAGNSDNTTTLPVIGLAPVSPVSSIVLQDNDTANSWITKHDVTIKYTLPTYSSTVTADPDFHTDFYLIPANVGLDFSSMYRINSADVQNKTGGTQYTYNGVDTDYSLYYDSRTNYSAYASGSYTNLQFFGINADTKYIACAVVSIDPHSSETSANLSIPRCSEPMSFTAESWSEQTSAPWIKSYTPNSSKVYTNTKIYSMTFSEALDATSAKTLSNYSLKYDSDGNWTYDTDVSLSSVTYDENSYTVYVKTTTNLISNKWYYLKVKTGVKDLYGTSIYDGAGMYFQTTTESDSTGPGVSSSNIVNNQTNVSASLSRISIKFDEPMDPTTITTTSATLDPAVAGVNISYDVSANTLKYTFGNINLSENTTYKFTLNGGLITDSQGNMLDGDGDTSPGGNYVLNFTTGTLDTTQPKIMWSTFDGYNLKAGFDREMMESDVEDYKNWTLVCGTTTQSLNWATFNYDEYNFELSITGLYCSDGTSYTLTASKGMRGGNKSTIDTTANSSTDTVTSSTKSGYGDTTDSYYGTYASVYAWPSDNSASATTDYYISLPTTKALQDGGKITIQWPSGFNIANVKPKTVDVTQSSYSYNNSDLNGSWTGLYDKVDGTLSKEGAVKFFDTADAASCPSSTECVKNDTLTNTTTLTLWMDYNNDGVRDTTAVTAKKDYIYFDLSGVVNPSKASEVHWYTSTGGYKLNITTKNAKGAPLEGPIASSNFAIVPAGTGTLSGVVTANTVTGDPVANVTVYASSSSTTKKATTGSDGKWTITGVQNGTWWFWVDPPKTGQYSTTYSSTSNSCDITSTKQTCTYNGIVKKFDYTITGTIIHDKSLAGKAVTIWQNSQSDYSWSSVNKVLDSSGSTSFTIYTSTGKHQIGIYESLYSGSFVSPSPKTIDVKGNTSNVNFNIRTANLSVPITVLDDKGAGLSNVSVGVYSYDEGYGFSTWGTTGADGKTTLKVVAGDYTAYAYQYGFGNGELAISVKTDGTVSPTGGPVFKFKKADSTIKGTVLDDSGNPIQWASISYKDTNGMSQWASTDTNGSYTLWVPGGTDVKGSVTAYSWQYGGNIPAKSGVTATNFSVPSASTTTGIDFQYDPTAYGKISGQISASGSGVSWASVWAEEVNKTTRKKTSNYYGGSWTTTDSNGNYTLQVTKNTATTCYDIHGWASNYGELPKISCLDISSGDLTGKNWDLGTLKTVTVTVAGAPTSVTKAYLDLKQSGTDSGLWTSIDLANGSGTASFTVTQATYNAKLSIEGFGEFKPDGTDASSFTVSADKTLTFSLATQISAGWTLSGTVKDETGTVVDNARVVVFNKSTGDQASAKTSTAGTYTLSAKALSSGSTYVMYASKSGYVNSETNTVAASGTYNFTVTRAGSSISGTAYDKDGNTVEDVWLIARAKNSDKWSSTKSLGDGTFSLSVPADSTVSWDLEGVSKNGYRASITGVSPGVTNLQLNLKTLAVTGLADQECVSVVPSQGGTLSDSEQTGVDVKLPANSYTDSSGGASATGTLCSQEIATPSSTTDAVDVVGPAKEITINDSQGQEQTKFQSDLDLTFTLTKSDVDAAITSGSLSSYSDLKLLHLNYWEDSSGTWVNMPTTLSIKVKATTADTSFTDTDYDTAIINIVANANYYVDYQIVLHTASSHLTIFGITVPADTTAPAAPSNLNAIASSGQVVLDWNDSTETDFLEYAVYRSTSSPVQAVNTNQINSSQVTASAYTDTTVTNGVMYYYAVAVADKSGNWSTLSSEVSAKPVTSGSTTTSSSSTSSFSSGGGSSSSSSSSETSAFTTSIEDTTSTSASTSPFLDVIGHWAESYIEILYSHGVVQGYTSDTYGPDNHLTRAEAAKIAINTWELVAPSVSTEPFPDVSVDVWYAPYVAKMKDLGVVQGYPDGTFHPDDSVNRAEAVKMFLGVAGKLVESVDLTTNVFTDVDTGAWYAPYVLYAQQHSYVNGYKDADGNFTGLFGPGDFITRGEIAKVAVLMAGL